MLKKIYVVGISGGSCSGKTTIADKLKAILGEKYKVAALHLDWYYKKPEVMTVAPITRIEYAEHNHPDVMDIDKIYKDFTAAIEDQTNDVVLVEGLFALYFEQLREKFDLKIFIDLKSDERIYRRIKRWIDHQTIDEIALRYLDTVRYRHDEFIEPTRWHADIVINGTLDANSGTNIAASYIESQILKYSESVAEMIDEDTCDIVVELGRTKNQGELKAGSILKLDNAINSHINLFANGNLIAEGRQYASNGNFAFYITEIVNNDFDGTYGEDLIYEGIRVEISRKKIPLRNIKYLKANDFIEFDKESKTVFNQEANTNVNETYADIFIGNALTSKGIVMGVEENWGVKITEIISR